MASAITSSTRGKNDASYMRNSHSNTKLPTWKASFIEGSRLSQIEQNKLKERSLDRVNSNMLLHNGLGGVASSSVV